MVLNKIPDGATCDLCTEALPVHAGRSAKKKDVVTGARIYLRNGITVSVQWSPFHYSVNRGWNPPGRYGGPSMLRPGDEDFTAEVAAWLTNGSGGDFIRLSEWDDVLGWQSLDQINLIIRLLDSLGEESRKAIRAGTFNMPTLVSEVMGDE